MNELHLTVIVPPDRRIQAQAIIDVIKASGRGELEENDLYSVALENGMSALARRYLPPGAPASSPANSTEPALAMAASHGAPASSPALRTTPHCDACAPEFTECWNDGSHCRIQPARNAATDGGAPSGGAR